MCLHCFARYQARCDSLIADLQVMQVSLLLPPP